MRVTELARTIGKGVVAGAIGTAAMTVSSTVEAKLRDREPSTTPAKAAQKVLGIRGFTSEGAEARFSNLVHWGYGTGWGVIRALIGTVLPPTAADAVHFATVWGVSVVTLPTLQVAPPVWDWERREVALDVLHHGVYAAATGIAFERLA
jgi:hypothetical protein